MLTVEIPDLKSPLWDNFSFAGLATECCGAAAKLSRPTVQDGSVTASLACEKCARHVGTWCFGKLAPKAGNGNPFYPKDPKAKG